MSFNQRVTELALAVGADMSTVLTLLNGKVSDLSALTTTDKSNLVAALNEVGSRLLTIDDLSTSTSTVLSSSEIVNRIDAAVSALVDSAPDTLNTLSELSAALQNNPAIITTILDAQAKRVAVDQAQSFTTAEQIVGCTNIGVGDPTVDLTLVYTTERDA